MIKFRVFVAVVLSVVASSQVAVGQNQPLGPRQQAAPQAQAYAPPGFPLDAAHQQWVDQILAFWEQHSAKIQRYQCDFNRWEYDPVFGPAPNPQTGQDVAKTYSTGEIKYESPDKGSFEVKTIQVYKATQADGQPTYVARDDVAKEHWVCNGKSIFEFDYKNKQLKETELPPSMQGRAIVDGPLPFLFGAEAEKIKQRYWIRGVTPPDVQGQYWLEAIPKTRADAANFLKVLVILDQQQFLPLAMRVFPPNFHERNNRTMTAYQFQNREVNASNITQNLLLWQRAFHDPPTPKGWQRVVNRHQPDVATNGQASQNR